MNMMQLQSAIKKCITPLKNRVYTMITRAVLETVNDSEQMQELKLNLLAGESRTNVERFQDFGFSSNPPTSSEVIALSVGGNRDHLIAIVAHDRATRVKDLASGESVVYTDDGTKIHLKKGGIVDVITATQVNINCPESVFSGNVTIQGNLTVIGTSLLTGAVSMLNTLTVALTATISGLLSALGYSGLGGGAVTSSVDISTSANVSGGGTDLATIKTTFNTHNHNETGTVTNAPNQSV